MDRNAENAAFDKRVEFETVPTLREIETGLQRWAQSHPDRLALERVGRSADGAHPILLCRVTDTAVSDEDKTTFLVTVTHTKEIRAVNAALHAIKWLIGDTPEACRLRRSAIVLFMPCTNPHGYERILEVDDWLDINSRGGTAVHPASSNAEGLPQYNGFTLDGVKDPDRNPECVAIQAVADRYRPDVSLDVHGVYFRNSTMFESTNKSWLNSLARGFHPAFVEAVDNAVEREGFYIVRPESDSGVQWTDRPVEGGGDHFFCPGEGLTIQTFLFHRYHTLGMMCESGYIEATLARVRAILELCSKTWRGEFYTGPPVNTVASTASMCLTAWGETASERRASRTELWRKKQSIGYGVFAPEPFVGAIGGFLATDPVREQQYFPHKRQGVDDLLATMRSDPAMEEGPVEAFVRASRICRYINARTGNGPAADLRHGIAARFWIPYDDATVTDVRINGQPMARSASDGYLVKHGPGTIVQLNIPPEKADGIFFMTCLYDTETDRRQGFLPDDWGLHTTS